MYKYSYIGFAVSSKLAIQCKCSFHPPMHDESTYNTDKFYVTSKDILYSYSVTRVYELILELYVLTT